MIPSQHDTNERQQNIILIVARRSQGESPRIFVPHMRPPGAVFQKCQEGQTERKKKVCERGGMWCENRKKESEPKRGKYT